MKYCHGFGFYQLGVGSYEGITTKEVQKRFLIATGLSSFTALARWMDTPRWSLYDARAKNILPQIWLRRYVQSALNYWLVWIVTGQGPEIMYAPDGEIFQIHYGGFSKHFPDLQSCP